MLFNLW